MVSLRRTENIATVGEVAAGISGRDLIQGQRKRILQRLVRPGLSAPQPFFEFGKGELDRGLIW